MKFPLYNLSLQTRCTIFFFAAVLSDVERFLDFLNFCPFHSEVRWNGDEKLYNEFQRVDAKGELQSWRLRRSNERNFSAIFLNFWEISTTRVSFIFHLLHDVEIPLDEKVGKVGISGFKTRPMILKWLYDFISTKYDFSSRKL